MTVGRAQRMCPSTARAFAAIGSALVVAVVIGATAVHSAHPDRSSAVAAAGNAGGGRWTAVESVGDAVLVRPPAGVQAPASLSVDRPVVGAELQAIARDPGGNFVAVWSTPGSNVLLMARHPFLRGEQHPGPGFDVPIPIDDAWFVGTSVRLAPREDGAVVRFLRTGPGGRAVVATRQVAFDPYCRPVSAGSSSPLH